MASTDGLTSAFGRKQTLIKTLYGVSHSIAARPLVPVILDGTVLKWGTVEQAEIEPCRAHEGATSLCYRHMWSVSQFSWQTIASPQTQ